MQTKIDKNESDADGVQQEGFIESLKSKILAHMPTSPDWAEDNTIALHCLLPAIT